MEVTSPNDVKAEKDVLKSCFSGIYKSDVVKRVVTELSASHFVHPTAKDIYDAIAEAQYATGETELDWREVRSYIPEGSEAKLTVKKMVDENVGYSNHHLDKAFTKLHALRKARMLRVLVSDAENLATLGHAEQAIEGLLDGVFELVRDPHTTGAKYVAEYVQEAIEDIEKRRNNDGLVGYETGLDPFDELLGGLQDERFIILAARPGMYKSTGLGQVAIKLAMDGNPALICSSEMAAKDYILRWAVPEAKIDYGMYSSGKFSDEEEARIKQAIDLMKAKKLIINASAGQSTTTIRQDLIRHRPAALFVDYLQEMQPRNPQENEYKDTTAVGRELNALKKSFKIPVVAAAQLNRDVEKREPWDRRPVMSDLRATGWLEQLADHIFFLYHPKKYAEYDEQIDEYYFQKGSGQNSERIWVDEELVEWVVGKNRFGDDDTDYNTYVNAKYLKLRNKKREWYE